MCATTSYTHARPLGRVLVLGLGKSGQAVASYLLDQPRSRVSSVTIVGGATSQPSDITRELAARGAAVFVGTEDIPGTFDLCIVSPGIPETSSFFASAKAASDTLIGEPEFAWQESPECWIGITGTNGKTTTTTLIGALLSTNGMPCECVGNIGTLSISRISSRTPDEWFACELSSFQLATTKELHPRAAILLNITPDHIAWHGSMQAYANAKEKIFTNLDHHDLAVCSEQGMCAPIIQRLDERDLRVVHLCPEADPKTPFAAFMREGHLIVRLDGVETDLLAVSEMRLAGEHNVENALAAAAVALDLGISAQDVAHTLASFAPLEHRIEPCGASHGITFVNDSKATNTDAAIKALTAFTPGKVVLMVGGHDKGTDLGAFTHASLAAAHTIVCFGEAGPRFFDALTHEATTLASDIQIIAAQHLEDALDTAIAHARPGDTVLLSPACSSFDEFSGYEERGRYFKSLVKTRIAQGQV